MPHRIIIAVNGSTASSADKNALTAFFQGKGLQVWHWFDELWLISDVPDDTDVRAFTKEISAIPGFGQKGAQFVVIGVNGDSPYYGWAKRESWDWMKEHWGAPAK
jgi:hypothetical protein